MINDEMLLSSKNSIENLKNLSSKQLAVSERRICEIAELADDAVSYFSMISDVEIYEMLSSISEEYREAEFIFDKVLSENVTRLEKNVKNFLADDKIFFADLFVELYRKRGLDISEHDFLPGDECDETFVYVKNVYADEAYDVFSQDFSDPRVRYAKDFREATGLAAEGTVTYCLLPLEEKGARLASVSELLYRSDLKINSVIPVFGIDGTANIKYALVSRHFNVPQHAADDDRYLEIRISDNSASGLTDVLRAAEYYGINVYRVNTISFDTEEGEQGYYSVVFSGENVDFTSLLVFLTLFVSDYTAVGIYKNLES